MAAMSAIDLEVIRVSLYERGTYDPAFGPILVAAIASSATRETAAFLLRAAFAKGGRDALAHDDGARLLAAIVDMPEGEAWDPVLPMLSAWGDPRAAAMLVEKMEQWKSAGRAMTAISEFPPAVAGAAFSARFETNAPVAFRENGRNLYGSLERIVENLHRHVTRWPAWPADVTALETAIVDGDLETVEELLAKGTDPNSAMLKESTSLLVTAIGRAYADAAEPSMRGTRLKVVQLLLDRGASTRAKLEVGPWQCCDRLFRVSDNAMTIATEMLEAVTPPYLAPGAYKDWEIVAIPNKTRDKMRPSVAKLAAMVEAAHQQQAPKKTAPKSRAKATTSRRAKRG